MQALKRLQVFLLLILFHHLDAHAQLCQSLGDPIIKKTFGAGPNPGAALPAGTNNYTYVGSDCPADGEYTVRNSSTSCFSGSWFNVVSDHTGDPQGYFMLINASFDPGDFYLDTVRGLCANTTYQLSSWVLNILGSSGCGTPIQPNLTFKVERTDGTELASLNAAIPAAGGPVWTEYGVFFTTPPGVSDVVVRIRNNAPGGCGNDLALDDITFRACGPQINVNISGNTASQVEFCEGTSKNYQFVANISSGFNSPVFLWQEKIDNGNWADIPGETSLNLTRNFPSNANAGQYQYRVTVAEAGNINSVNCRVSSTPLTVTIHPLPIVQVSSNSPLCEKQNIELIASGGTQYQWSGPLSFQSFDANPTIHNAVTGMAGIYGVSVTTAFGCQASDQVSVVVNPKPQISILPGSASICAGDSILIQVSGGAGYTWFPTDGLNTDVLDFVWAKPLASIMYQVTAENSFGCKDTAFTDISVLQKPVANAGPDKVGILNQPVLLSGSASGSNYTIEWSPVASLSDPGILQPWATPQSDQYYILKLTSTQGCGTDQDTMFVKLYNAIDIPNAFTPNGDGLNDFWKVPALLAFNNYRVTVFNRWGTKIFETNDISSGWDGKLKGQEQPTGVYVYIITIGNNSDFYKGTFTLIR